MAATAFRRVQRAARHAGRAVSRRRTPVLVGGLLAGSVLALGVFGLADTQGQEMQHEQRFPHSINQHVAPGWQGQHPGPPGERDDD